MQENPRFSENPLPKSDVESRQPEVSTVRVGSAVPGLFYLNPETGQLKEDIIEKAEQISRGQH